MHISNKLKKTVLGNILFNGCPITEVKYYPNLGLILNDKLNWSDHAEHILTKASKNMLNRVRHIIPRLALENLYTSMVRPILDYANII